MKKYPCPSCGAEIPFRTSIAAYGVCPYCRTMVVRDDESLRKIGEMAQLPEDMSPFQIGSEGTFKGVRFGIVGRMKIGWEDGNWNEWFIVSDSGKKGWLAEAQGFYSPCFETAELDEGTKEGLDKIAKWAQGGKKEKNPLGAKLRINKNWYKIVDIKDAECIGSEGELPFSAPKGRTTTSIDLLKDEGDFASIEITKDGVRVYEGAYVDWEQLNCKYFRTFEGW